MVITISTGIVEIFSSEVTPKELESVISFINRLKQETDSYMKVIHKVCDYYPDMTYEQLKSRSRLDEYTAARSIIYHRLVRVLGMTLDNVGALFNRDHATVHNGLKTAQKRCKPAYFNIFGEEMI